MDVREAGPFPELHGRMDKNDLGYFSSWGRFFLSNEHVPFEIDEKGKKMASQSVPSARDSFGW